MESHRLPSQLRVEDGKARPPSPTLNGFQGVACAAKTFVIEKLQHSLFRSLATPSGPLR
jgi:hypothetical protein